MKYAFRLPDFPLNNFELETPAWKGKPTLFMDGEILKQSAEKGEPYLIPAGNGTFVQAFPKYKFPDTVPALEINGQKNQIAEKLHPIQFIFGALPVVLLFLGGAIGGATGLMGALLNFKILRQEGSLTAKYLKVFGINVLAFALYTLIAGLFHLYFKR